MFSNILGGAAGFPVADLGDEISQSLRFTGGSQTMQRTFSSTFNASGTLSAWIKVGSSDDAYFFGGNVSGHYEIIGQASQQFYGADRFGSNTYANGKQRDYSGWYHICINFNSGNWWINGQQQSNNLALSNHSNMNNWNVGYSIQGSRPFDGYMAEVIFVDGSDIAETNFGRYQEDGVWVPKNYTGTYGTNGFRLDFADSSDLGNDVSGNNNDFTAVGFDTADIALYSKDLSTPTGFNSGSQSAASAFDGNTSTTCFASGAGAVGKTITWAPSTAISFTTLEALNGGNQNYQLGSGSLVTSVANTFTTVATNGTVSSSNPFKTISTNAATTPTLNAIRIDGTILADNFDNDVDYNDTPTSNYNTANPVGTTVSEFTKGNLEVGTTSSGTWQGAYGTFPIQSGKWYWEMQVGAADGMIGVSSNHRAAPTYSSQAGEYAFRVNGSLYNNGSSSSGYSSAATTGDIIGVAFDADSGTLWYSINGVWGNSATQAEIEAGTTTNSANTGMPDAIYVPFFASVSTPAQDYNFGQRPFLYTKPTGYEALNSNKMAEPTIKNSSDHFQAITATGSNILTSAQAAFSNGLYWIKDRDNNNTQHQLVDTVRGTSATIKKSPGLANNAAYSAPSGNSIAWCWNAPDEMDQTTRESGDINVTAGRVNQDAGFSILEFTGNSTNGQTVAHGLTQAPEFMIAIAQGNTNSMPCWHGHASGAPNAATSLLNGSTSFTLTHVAAVSDQFITIQGNTAINDTDTMSMYLWHSVPGYSAFGRYSGNQSSDGVFIYTGFAPRFIILKGANLTSDWILLDSSRSIANPRNASLYPNYSLDEQISSTLNVDFLSNGFKLRTDNATLNQGYQYCYSCWAEHPFGGENAAPATAR